MGGWVGAQPRDTLAVLENPAAWHFTALMQQPAKTCATATMISDHVPVRIQGGRPVGGQVGRL
jgi:hypothetical protein